jgi:CRISPR-associated protein Csx17
VTALIRHQHRLLGCRPEPLGSYLKALGLFRLVALQVDPTATGWWAGDAFVLESVLDEQGLEDFLLAQYQPTPILSPWNNSSGFGPEGHDELGVIERSTELRLASYREAIAAARAIMTSRSWPTDGKDAKELRVSACRSGLPEPCLPWIDAAVVLTDGRAVFPPILGTGGNDGRLEFSRNFHQRVLDVLGMSKATRSRRSGWLRDSLDGTQSTALLANKSPGQFDGGVSGGPNSSALGAATSLLNPWDWVLLIEGSLLFASGAARRLAASTGGRAAAPFTVERSAVGYDSAAEAEGSRGELWLPLWGRPAPFAEVRRLFAEARADWRGRHARSGLELAEAANGLGVDRGVTGFSRHALLERNGLATFATPVGRVAVRPRRTIDPIAPLEKLDEWLERIRRVPHLPTQMAIALREVERREFALVTGSGRASDLLLAASDLDLAVARSAAGRAGARPLELAGVPWASVLTDEDDSVELRLSLGLASGADRNASGRITSSLRRLVRPWWDGPSLVVAPVDGLGRRSIVSVLADAHARRAVELVQQRRRSENARETPGLPTGFSHGTALGLSDVAALVSGSVDHVQLSKLVTACLVLDFGSRHSGPFPVSTAIIPPAFSLIGPFYARTRGNGPGDGAGIEPVHRPGPGDLPEAAYQRQQAEREHRRRWRAQLARTALEPEPSWPALLAAGRLDPVVQAAGRRLRIAGLRPIVPAPKADSRASQDSARRLGAALLCAIAPRDGVRLLEQSCPPLVDQGEDHAAS